MNSQPPARRVTARSERDAIAAELRAQYEAGASVRSLARQTNRSYGSVHYLLTGAGVTFRPRGGIRRPGRPWEETSNYSPRRAMEGN
ncbi:helix-turn-helix domain-containing protein [Actinacidiphila glaucinigra]|uniref:helix-turn-helix domain-containing protein n=1 Tax=Actinacidiphila glaucinigra TaxID=235986 RepID=UPI0035DC014A